MYKKTLDRFIDFLKSLSVGTLVASLVGFILQKNEASWKLLIISFIVFAFFLSLSIFYDRRYPND